jgi:hypothetical protein
MLKSLQHCLHQLVLVGNELFNLRVGLVVGVATLAIAVVPCLHHLRDFNKGRMRYKARIAYPATCTGKNADTTNFIIIMSMKDAVVDKAPRQPTTHTDTHSVKPIINHHTSND